MRNANDELKEYNCSDNFYKYNFGLIITDGVKALADKFSCYWFLDIVASYQPQLKEEEFQVWKLQRNGNSAIVTCENGNDLQLKSQTIPWTDFEPDTCIVWIEGNNETGFVCLLPSEH